MPARTLRRKFVAGLVTGLRVVWPILSVLLVLIIALVITALDYVLSLILVHLIPSLFAGR